MSAITSSANGTYVDCGLGQGVGLTITCGGSSCGVLSQFPQLACSNDTISSTTHCNNGVTCPGTPNFKSIFQMQQHPDDTVSTQQDLQIDGQNFQGTDDGHGVVSYSQVDLPGTSTSSTTSPVGGSSVGGTSVGGTSVFVGGTPDVGPGTSGSATNTAHSSNSAVGLATSNARSHKKPRVSKALLAILVIMGMFVSQTHADTSFFRFKEMALATELSVLWFLSLIPEHIHAQCTTEALYPVATARYLDNKLAINPRAVSLSHLRRISL